MTEFLIETNFEAVPHGDITALAKEKMYADFARLLNGTDDVRKAWKGSKADLFEMAYRTYYANRIIDCNGVPLPFTRVCAILCNRFHIRCPHNIYDTALIACRRRGIRSQTLLKRYEWRIKHN
ncbi:MAG: hypothetical protein ACOYJG_10785 [Prevotella sp.]